jgi:hypothetical protein
LLILLRRKIFYAAYSYYSKTPWVCQPYALPH